MNVPLDAAIHSPPIARGIARYAMAFSNGNPILTDKVRTCVYDCLAGALLSRDLPWSRQTIDYANAMGGTGTTIVAASRTAGCADAAFANATMAHGLVQEDMHAAAVAHIGVVIIPTLLALAEGERVTGKTFIDAVVVGYQVMARLGRALITREVARTFRPTGLIGAIAAAAAGARIRGLTEDAAVSAVALAANTASGLNEWPHTGGSEMYFHPGFAARNAITSILLAKLGARCSETAIDGPGGLLAGYRALPASRHWLEDFSGADEILEVYHKPVPACNYAQTPAQAALAVARQLNAPLDSIRAIRVRSFPAAIEYPGCNGAGPFANVLQAKMSMQFAVATALVTGSVAEENFRVQDDPRVARLCSKISFEVDDAFTRAFPPSQGAEVIVELIDGRRVAARLDDVVSLAPPAVQARFHAASTRVFGEHRTKEIELLIDALPTLDDMTRLIRLLRAA
ncbi:MAG: MmgE/PrpD family protein [Betaproteobacteria bacterium]|nr:MmgE/PrpD family protein [Betaproteobacteria bacterium]